MVVSNSSIINILVTESEKPYPCINDFGILLKKNDFGMDLTYFGTNWYLFLGTSMSQPSISA